MPIPTPAHAPSPIASGWERTRTLLLRLGVGLVQGLLVWQLWWYGSEAFGLHLPVFVYAALVLCTAFVPLIALSQIGSMRWRNLLLYLASACAALFALADYDVWRKADPELSFPAFRLLVGAGIGLFIANQLLDHRERGYRLFDNYSAYVERGWMCMAQFMLAALFACMSRGVLDLGGSLFAMLGLRGMSAQLGQPWFTCVETAMAFALGIHLTDVRPGLLAGVRNILLMLMAWLLPLVVALGWCFLVALAFTGLRPLWATHYAAGSMLGAAWVTLVLLNAAYKDGWHERAPALAIRWAGRAAGPMLLALAVLAFFGLMQRIGQHGWSPERIFGIAVGAVALLYGVGYTWAALRRGPWLRGLEPVNVVASLFILVLILGLLTPAADPDRLAVSSQLARLREGKVSAKAFDFKLLRDGHYGKQALQQLEKSHDAQIAALARKPQREEPPKPAPRPPPEPPLSHARIYPPGATLPADFRSMHWAGMDTYDAACLVNGSACEIFTLFPHRGVPGYVVVHPLEADSFSRSKATVFASAGHGRWYRVGKLEGMQCPGVVEALRAGRAQPLHPRFEDVGVDGLRLEVEPAMRVNPCPAPAP